MSLGLQCLLLLAISSSLLALPVYKTRRGDNFERSFGSRVSRDAETSNTKGEENEFLFEGDIKLEDGYNPYADQMVKREAGGSGDGVEVEVEPSAVPDEKAFQLRDDLWVEGKVPYKFETSLSPMYRDIFTEAMKWWSNATGGCVSFHHASQNDQDFLLYRKDNGGCSSFVGRRGGEQYLNISSTCSGVGNAAHEIGHALGLWHEHSRPDRDLYINVLTDNIKSQKIADNNFGLLSQKTFSKVPPVTYDIESIMHYGAYAFTNDQTKKTIEVRDGADWDMCDNPEEMGQRERISHKDTLRIKMLYGCGVVTPMDMPQSCETTTPTPTPTTPLASTPTPTPTATIRLISNNVITLQFFAGPINDKNELTKYGVRCVPSPGCTPTPCISLGGTDGHCSVAKNEFRIIRPGDAKIRAGDKVLLRSVHKSSMWLNCSSGINNECNISPCTSNAADPSNSSYISECKDHFFIIEGIGRKSGKILSTKHQIQFKSYENNKYLNCEDKKCRLIEANECPATDSNENNCDTGIQSYNITKIREY